MIGRYIHSVMNIPQRHFLLSVFLCAVLVRLAILVWTPLEDHGDLYEHGAIAHNLVAGHGFSMHWPYTPIDPQRAEELRQVVKYEGAFLPPLNPYLLATFYTIGGENVGARTAYNIFLCIVSALVPVVMYKLTRKFASEGVARLAAVLSCFNLFAAFAVSTFSGSSLYHLLTPLSFYLLFIAYEKKKIVFFGLLGVILGLLTLVRSEYFLLSPLMIIIGGIVWKERTAVRMQLVGVTMIAYLMVVTPWIYRNTQLFDEFVPILSHPWFEVWRGNGPSPDWVEAAHHPGLVTAMDNIPYDQRFEVAVDSLFKEAVLASWQRDPWYAIGVGFQKIAMFATTDYTGGVAKNVVYGSVSFFLFCFTVVGIIKLFANAVGKYSREAALLFAVFLVYYLGLTFFTIMLPRHQIFALNSLLPAAAVGVGMVLWRGRQHADDATPPLYHAVPNGNRLDFVRSQEGMTTRGND